MKELDKLLEESMKNAPPTFHPVHVRDESAWFPGNEASSLLIQLSYIWEDIGCLSKLHKIAGDAYSKKLMLKYVLVELRSFLKLFDRLQSIVMKTPIFDPKEKHGYREITKEEREKARILFDEYSTAKSSVEIKIISIRNNIGAHRENLDWQEVMKLWDILDPSLIKDLLRVIPEFFAYIKELDVYDWNRSTGDGGIEIMGPHIRPEYFMDDR
jgi:hypothetical protein